MANLIIKPAAVADSFQMKDAGSNVILTVEGQTDSSVAAAGRIVYGKGVCETAGTITQASAVVTIDLATGTFFEHQLTAAATTWKILHIPASGTIAAWVVKLQNGGSLYGNTWAGATDSTYDNGTTFPSVTTAPDFHFAGGTHHILTATVSRYDIITFWTKGGASPVIYSAVSGQDFLT